jgi:RNA polymerase sigma-70 factor, ECF subfamily
VDGVKAALNRGRSKLASSTEGPSSLHHTDAETSRLLQLYVERFNRRDWDGLRERIAADAQLRVADRFIGRLAESRYLSNYERRSVPWRMAVGEVDSESVVVILHGTTRWTPTAPIRLTIQNDRVTCIADYVHCPWILQTATSVLTADASEPH